MKDADEDTETGEIDEDWIEYTQRSTAKAVERMKAAQIPCWLKRTSE